MHEKIKVGLKQVSFLSLLPLSCMVAPIRELVNTLYPSTSKPQNNQLYLSKYYLIDIEIDLPREQFFSFSTNSLRGTSVNSTTSSIVYAEQMQAKSRNWYE